jgi:SAM-dependent methyltransferase
MAPACDLCGSAATEPVYDVPDSARQARVHLCSACGLLQSQYGAPAPSRALSLSSGPGWGNVRHGKGLRLDANIDFILRHEGSLPQGKVLDVGSNRGHFAEHVLSHSSGVTEFVALEPDASIIDSYRETPGLTLVNERFEHATLPDRFDFIYCSHTLEHADSAREMLQTLRDLLAPDGSVFLEVPSVRILERSDHLEEFFIDKHSFHFHPSTLEASAESVGFAIAARQPADDQSHVTLLLRGGDEDAGGTFPPEDGSLAEVAGKVRENVARYVDILRTNLARLDQACATIEFLVQRQDGVVLWGAGRQLDALLAHTEFDLHQVDAVVDEHLSGIVAEVQGVPIQKPDVLRTISPAVVVAFARNGYPEIADRARSYGVRNVIQFSALLGG